MTKKRPTAFDVKTLPYPGFPTDMQAQVMALMSISGGVSVITETIFENRMMHAAELRRMGADVRVIGNTAIVKGVKAAPGREGDGHGPAGERVPHPCGPLRLRHDGGLPDLPYRQGIRGDREEAERPRGADREEEG